MSVATQHPALGTLSEQERVTQVYSEEDTAEKTQFRKHKTLLTFIFFHPPDIKIVKTKIRRILRGFYTAQRMSIKFQDIRSMIHVHQQSL